MKKVMVKDCVCSCLLCAVVEKSKCLLVKTSPKMLSTLLRVYRGISLTPEFVSGMTGVSTDT